MDARSAAVSPAAAKIFCTMPVFACPYSSMLAARIPARLLTAAYFAPWHYGDDARDGHTAANDLTLGAWDPVSKQPEFKVAAVSVERVAAGTGPAPAPTTTASAPVHPLDDAKAGPE
jgi:predicted molibdopterin-dependent oxidoreductase YjgC